MIWTSQYITKHDGGSVLETCFLHCCRINEQRIWYQHIQQPTSENWLSFMNSKRDIQWKSNLQERKQVQRKCKQLVWNVVVPSTCRSCSMKTSKLFHSHSCDLWIEISDYYIHTISYQSDVANVFIRTCLERVLLSFFFFFFVSDTSTYSRSTLQSPHKRLTLRFFPHHTTLNMRIALWKIIFHQKQCFFLTRLWSVIFLSRHFTSFYLTLCYFLLKKGILASAFPFECDKFWRLIAYKLFI